LEASKPVDDTMTHALHRTNEHEPKSNLSAQEKVSKLTRKLISNTHIYSKSKEKATDSVNELDKNIREIQTEINEIIYDMYHITNEEKKIIEESLK
jgi:hypothetical protein